MEVTMPIKLVPTYDLKNIKKVFCSSDKLVMTSSAKKGQVSLGFSEEDVVDAIQALKKADFYKSMPPVHQAFSAWQDVYKARFKAVDLYIKFQVNMKRELILSFKGK